MIYTPLKWGIISSLILTAAACDQLNDLLAVQPEEVKVCEQFLIAKLKSPSSYNFLEYKMFDTKLRNIEYLIKLFPNLRSSWKKYQSERSEETRQIIEDFSKAATAPVERMIVIDYEASNSYGAQIKGTEYCKFLSRDGEPLEFHETQVDVWISFIPLGETKCCIRPNERIR